ncbi:MAG: M20/M25/M40 family metallo-hydrolase [Candidatus Margulisbacteria bacterium]|nr:M20/M25/M40 family metallo-hydrolase [Candidatus Margulisiibacteriota bacterium]
MINKKRLVNTFKKLVKIDSLSLKEGKIVKHLKKELKTLGLRPYEAGKPKDGEVGNLIADFPGKGPRIILNAHVDTVSPGKNIKPVERGNRIYPAGKTILGADDKTGVAVILEVLKVIKKNKLPHPAIRVIFTVAEEIGIVGAKVLPKNLLKADFGITLDHGSVQKIINQAPSQVNFTATIFGRSAHAGIHPEDGINAIKVAAIAISKMKFGRIDKETTSNIGVIKGGKATNIVPDKVEIKGEARSHDRVKMWCQLRHMQIVLMRTCAKYKAKVKITANKVYNSFEVKKKCKVVKLAFSAIKKAGYKPRLMPSGGGSDANIFNAAGVPTLNMGVGMHRVHTAREYADVNEMVAGAEIVINLIAECAK